MTELKSQRSIKSPPRKQRCAAKFVTDKKIIASISGGVKDDARGNSQFSLNSGSMWFRVPPVKMTVSKETVRKEELMEQNVYFERCIDFLSRMIEKYGDELLREEMAAKDIQEKSLPGKTSEYVA